VVEFLPIHYFSFWDIPRSFALEWKRSKLFFHSHFDDDADDYARFFEVTLMSDAFVVDWVSVPSGQFASQIVRVLGEVPIEAVQFDVTRRKYIRSAPILPYLAKFFPEELI
jgi:hypothetical protein